MLKLNFPRFSNGSWSKRQNKSAKIGETSAEITPFDSLDDGYNLGETAWGSGQKFPNLPPPNQATPFRRSVKGSFRRFRFGSLDQIVFLVFIFIVFQLHLTPIFLFLSLSNQKFFLSEPLKVF